MLAVAEAVQGRLEATGHIEARLSREPGDEPDYPSRAEDAALWGADAFASLHSDVRGTMRSWFPDAPACLPTRNGRGCAPDGGDARRCPAPWMRRDSRCCTRTRGNLRSSGAALV